MADRSELAVRSTLVAMFSKLSSSFAVVDVAAAAGVAGCGCSGRGVAGWRPAAGVRRVAATSSLRKQAVGRGAGGGGGAPLRARWPADSRAINGRAHAHLALARSKRRCPR